MKLHQKVILGSLALFGSYQLQAQTSKIENSLENKTVFVEADFNNDNHPDKMELILNNNEVDIFYHQNMGNNTYMTAKHLDTIPFTNGIGYHVGYNAKDGKNHLIIGPLDNQNGLNFNDARDISIRLVKK